MRRPPFSSARRARRRCPAESGRLPANRASASCCACNLNARLTGRRTTGRSGGGNAYLDTDAAGRFVTMLEKVTTHALTITHEGFTGTSASFVVSRTGEDVQGVDIVLTDAVPDHGPTGWVESPANGHRYKSVEAGSWFECHLAAIAMGAHIVTIADAAEQQWLLDTFGADEPYWIGLTDEPVEGAWRWVTGEPLVYTNWGDGEPNDAHTGGEDYAHMNWEGARPGSGGWRDLGYTGPDWYTVRKAILETGAIGGRETAPGYER